MNTTTSQNNTSNATRTTKTATVAALLAVVAVVGATALMAGHRGVETPVATAEVVQLERVVVLGKRAAAAETDESTAIAVAQLPRVVITGRSAAASAENSQQGGNLRMAAANVMGAIKAKAL